MFVWALEPDSSGSTSSSLPAAVRDGELWRLFTWPFANEPSLWTVITLAIFWYFGREIEGLLGRTKFAIMLLLLTVIPGVVGTILDLPQAGIRPLELAVFLVFIAEYPFARFFFGIPAWALGAVFVGIEVLQLLGERNEKGIIFLFVTIATAALSARAMGLAQSLPWIPKIPIPSGGGGGGRKRRPPTRLAGGGGEVVAGPWSATSRTGPSRSATLPQPPAPASSEHDQAELDALLDKISANGMDGLSADEKRRLNELSKRLRNRK